MGLGFAGEHAAGQCHRQNSQQAHDHGIQGAMMFLAVCSSPLNCMLPLAVPLFQEPATLDFWRAARVYSWAPASMSIRSISV